MILIRADANEIIGTGHIMRCLSIARAFAEKGNDVVFITADNKGDALIQQNGFNSICLDSMWNDMEPEINKLISVINAHHPSLLLIDSYYVTESYFRELGKTTRIAYVDDLNAARWDVDYLINYNIFSSVYDYSWYDGTKTKLLLYPQYAPLRDEFKNLPMHEIKGTVTDILVSAGGADPERISERLIKKVCPKWPEVRFHFIVGALNPRLDNIKKLEAENVVLHINEKHMSELMKQCDIAISASGTTLYELCATGIPTITFSLADNQIPATEQFEKQGIMLSAGDCRGNTRFISKVEKCLKTLADNVELRLALSRKMQELVDGKGAERLVEKLSLEGLIIH